jgi:hypothetical protein
MHLWLRSHAVSHCGVVAKDFLHVIPLYIALSLGQKLGMCQLGPKWFWTCCLLQCSKLAANLVSGVPLAFSSLCIYESSCLLTDCRLYQFVNLQAWSACAKAESVQAAKNLSIPLTRDLTKFSNVGTPRPRAIFGTSTKYGSTTSRATPSIHLSRKKLRSGVSYSFPG